MKSDTFERRHIGPSSLETQEMLRFLGYSSLDHLTQTAVPEGIQLKKPLQLNPALSEAEALESLMAVADQNKIFKSWIGMGYSSSFTPSVIRRTIFENPGWYTQYTPYQAEISQGRLEALLNFQTMIADLTGLPVANASLLDEATAAAEAMVLAYGSRSQDSSKLFLVAQDCHPQVLSVVQTRAEPLGIQVQSWDKRSEGLTAEVFGIFLQYPATDGNVFDVTPLSTAAHAKGIKVVVSADLLALTLFKSPGEMGADIAVGNTQRFGVPLGFGGPHAAYLSTKEEFTRRLPGRIVGVSKDAEGKPAIRLALQTREQHIRREKATSNICTAQVLLAIMASMFAVYHGPKGLTEIAKKIRLKAASLRAFLEQNGFKLGSAAFFDTLKIYCDDARKNELKARAESRSVNFRYDLKDGIVIALDETTTWDDLKVIAEIFAPGFKGDLIQVPAPGIVDSLQRKTEFLTHPVFSSYQSEHEMLRYLKRLEAKDLSLTTSMIPLGSCTMKLNAASEMFPVSWPAFSLLHPYVPIEQARGYKELFRGLESDLSEITGFDAVSLQPNSGAQGEYAGLLVIQAYHRSRGQSQRNVCLIPKSAHGTNPASAALAGMKVVVVECDQEGSIDVADLKKKSEENRDMLAALMVTYPSTHGVFEPAIREICDVVHANGGQVYMDGANLNAQLGLCRPGDFGPDVCHLNLHKTFCIPHGGGGPGMGPIAVKKHLAPFLPGHPITKTGGEKSIGPVSAAGWGSASILPISWMYIRMMGPDGLKRASQVAILNANYVAKKLNDSFPVLYKGNKNLVAHECILDLRPLKARTGIEVEDVAKRLMDYGFHAPTISFPVPGTLMIEPTESESQAELDRFCDAMIKIREEISEIESGKADAKNNLLKNAPHTAPMVTADQWDRPYTRGRAAFPVERLKAHKYWPPVARIDNVHGDRNLICACPPPEEWE